MKKSLINSVTLLTGILLLLNLLSYFGEYHFLLELLSHFRVQYLLLFLIAFLFFVITFNKKWIGLSFLGLVLNAIPVSSIYFPAKPVSEIENSSSILLTNVLSTNVRYDLLLDKIRTKKPDIIVVLELSRQWENALNQLSGDYPFNKKIARRDNFGIALLSKHPLHNIEVKDFANNHIPSIVARYRFKDEDITIIATHPFPPISKLLAGEQKIHLETLADYIIQLNQNNSKVVVAGDFNSTLWSPHYNNLIEKTRLINTRQGKGIVSTWPTQLKYSAMQIPLDHILTSQHFVVKKFEKLDSIGSDHLPLFVELGF